ncbi:MAG: hypothetical protein WC916_07050 [Candidatus Woesearchaeota archaeon]
MNKKNLRKKGQLQMGETIAIVIIVVLIIIFSIVFWGKVKKGDIQQVGSEQAELSVVEVSKLLNEMPELNCYQSGVQEVECVDLYKILALNATMNNDTTKNMTFDYYRNYFRTSRITFKQIYPTNISFVIYDNNISNSSSRQLYMPVLIKDSVKNTYNFGVIIVDGYYREIR